MNLQVEKRENTIGLRNIMQNIDTKSYTMIFALIAIWLILTITTGGTFLSSRNLALLFRQMSITAILAVGMVLVIVTGNIDLSIGSVAGIAGAVAAILHVWHDWSTGASWCAAIILGIVVGVWQGYWIAYKKVPAFIVTLGGMMIFRGLILMLTQSKTVAPLQPSFKFIGQAYLSKTVGFMLAVISVCLLIYFELRSRRSKVKYGFDIPPMYFTILRIVFFSALIIVFILVMNAYEGVPIPVIVMFVVGVIFTFIMTRLTFGRYLYALGGNVEAAKLSGLNIKKLTMIVFIIMGLLSAIAGIILTARLDAATTQAGNLFEMDAIASCVIGGTSLMGGVGSISGAIIGALVMASIDNGLSLMNTDPFYQYIIKGLILIIAVFIDIRSKSK